MNLMANIPFHIPHIYHSIADSLSFSDLLKCILVNRQWHDAFIPVLWSDVVTFRTNPKSSQEQEPYHDYTLYYHGAKGISRHAHHIRALTCQSFQSLHTLLNARSCTNLVEINFVIDLRSGSSGLDLLVDLMSMNPNLRAISIENVDLNDKPTESQLHGLLDFLDSTSSITSIYLATPVYPVRYGGSPCKKQWEAVWARMYSRIDRTNIHSLRIQTNHVPLSRSMRALAVARPWPARETPLTIPVTNTTFRRTLPSTGARWENEARSQSHADFYLAVQENNGSLELCASHLYICRLLCSLLQRPPPIYDPQVVSPQPSQEFFESMGTTLRQAFPNLGKLDFSHDFSGPLPMEHLLPSLTGLTSVSLPFSYNVMPPFALLLSQSNALSSLKILVEISMVDFFSIVTNCSNLQELEVSALHDVQGPELSPPWICKDIRKLDIQLMHRRRMSYLDYDDDASAFEQEIASAKRLAPSLLKQLGDLTHLHDLRLGLNIEYSVGESPFFQLSTDPVYGLPQLARLQQLKTFKVTGLLHTVGQEELEWMRTHWPLLFSLDIPIVGKKNGRRRQLFVNEFDGLAPAYEQWYPGLKVLIPESTYGCLMCQSVYCDYEDPYGNANADDYDAVGMVRVELEDMDSDKYEREEAVWALDDEYHLSKHYNVHKCEWWPKPTRRQMQCGHRIQRH